MWLIQGRKLSRSDWDEGDWYEGESVELRNTMRQGKASLLHSCKCEKRQRGLDGGGGEGLGLLFCVKVPVIHNTARSGYSTAESKKKGDHLACDIKGLLVGRAPIRFCGF